MFNSLWVVFSPRRAKKRPTITIKYHAAGSPELDEGQAKALWAKKEHTISINPCACVSSKIERLVVKMNDTKSVDVGNVWWFWFTTSAFDTCAGMGQAVGL
jgi:hypothetical protein